MRDIFVAGVGLTPAGEQWDSSLRELALNAIHAAQRDAPDLKPEALFVGNMLAGELSRQEHLGALIADFAGLRGIEAVTIEAAGASGGAALRQAVLAVGSGLMDTALVVGVEKITDKVGAGEVAAATATATDSDWEAAQGVTPTALAALIMRRYMHEHNVELKDFAGFSVNAHSNARANPNAMFRNALTPEAYIQAGMVSEPINLFDMAPECDGAAALLISAKPSAVRVAASTMATGTLAIHDRHDLLSFEAARLSVDKAYQLAGLHPDQISVFELHDAFTVFAALSLEAGGFAERGQGWRLAHTGDIAQTGRIPISTFGGLKARGNPGGATGVYQAAEVVLQLRGQAGQNQIPNAGWGMAQCLGGAGATAVTHIFQKIM
jgi:acetyl-CoA C-acetyltransferase